MFLLLGELKLWMIQQAIRRILTLRHYTNNKTIKTMKSLQLKSTNDNSGLPPTNKSLLFTIWRRWVDSEFSVDVIWIRLIRQCWRRDEKKKKDLFVVIEGVKLLSLHIRILCLNLEDFNFHRNSKASDMLSSSDSNTKLMRKDFFGNKSKSKSPFFTASFHRLWKPVCVFGRKKAFRSLLLFWWERWIKEKEIQIH